MRADQLLCIDASAELQRLCSARLQGSWQVPAELVRHAIARGATTVDLQFDRSGFVLEARGVATTDQEMTELAQALHSETLPEDRHRALLALESSSSDPLLFVAALKEARARISTCNGRDVVELELAGDAHPRRRPAAGGRGVWTRVQAEGSGFDSGRAVGWLRKVCRFVPIQITVDGEGLPRGFQGGLFKVRLDEPLPCQLAVARSGEASRLDLLYHGVLATRATVPSYPAFHAAVEMSAVVNAGASAASLREAVTPHLPALIDQAVGMLVRIVPRLPDLDEDGKRRIAGLLLQAARQGLRRSEILRLPILEELVDDGGERRWVRLSEVVERARGTAGTVRAVSSDMERRHFDLSGGPVLVVGAEERAELARIADLEFQPPPSRARRRWPETTAAGVAGALRRWRLAASRVAALFTPPVLAPSDLDSRERAFLIELTGSGVRWSDGRSARWGLRPGSGRARRVGRAATTVSLARQNGLVRRATDRVAVDPRWLYPALRALAPPLDLDLEELRRRWLEELG